MHLRRHIRLALLATTMALAACATAPVQEMSDARQALQAAEAVGAPEKARALYGEAKLLIERAESQLQAGDFRAARESARAAKERAIAARVEAVTQGAKAAPSP